MLTFASICPHPPLIIPAIGQNNLTQLQTTVNSLQKLNEKLLSDKPDTIVVISPHYHKPSEHFIMNIAPRYLGSLKNFGDLATGLEFAVNIELAEAVNSLNNGRKKTFPLQIINEEGVDYGLTIPLFYLTQKLIGVKLLALHPPISFNLQEIFSFGQLLKKACQKTTQKIALVASGDLSHTISPDSPIGGTSPRTKEFDHALIKFLKHKKINEIMAIEKNLSEEAKECGLKPIMLLLGALYRVPYVPQVLSYEHPFGIGYLTMEMKLKI
ncbi:hypothetical protein A3H03_02485 [Candidatus Kuenenbacteria bacterium RIFCSPLOWO2_12_FULL_42_13]|uniref:Extradiol ring-cleavage dioxygenase class III protein subunit B n=5 Tax=Candidatus Kueneniibacteriota TaxID=1752740 RepID=A0A0G1BT30_9BACT|nr:MAG: Extradiol ring-cleavage dioxygenase class III protein subunit B [Candidatus Kuenenbacteria bacterium GW2011_GWA2_42_15]OGG89411.1 MAG: hypothetical protein A3C68_00440 [Candidatus Kuenenbacteria bacterium RIFCSPHIGHO2_02_FULL_42_29]OGG91186.1 MAG: hypothetical protein A3H55_03505 [Candidatus Kuenenbacteria bacterium RIFCSPLOWO2_02_FULL_42_16]OGG92236.1 MAG: hypothetical protein A3H03_02485 [Candidatus Kuenenbacteria bacterium RIFCSPLOWO2_12_FULL_42_13]OGG95758.1 MAG: hypothetical protei